jgi:hypothetical protein
MFPNLGIRTLVLCLVAVAVAAPHAARQTARPARRYTMEQFLNTTSIAGATFSKESRIIVDSNVPGMRQIYVVGGVVSADWNNNYWGLVLDDVLSPWAPAGADPNHLSYETPNPHSSLPKKGRVDHNNYYQGAQECGSDRRRNSRTPKRHSTTLRYSTRRRCWWSRGSSMCATCGDASPTPAERNFDGRDFSDRHRPRAARRLQAHDPDPLRVMPQRRWST